jgi:type VI secretion system protein ImpJ
MYLGPHHFQAQNHYFEDALNFLTGSLWRDACGFAGLQFDHDALRNGTLVLTHARGLFADGLGFDLPASDAAPEARSFAGLFSPVADHLTVYLAVPRLKEDGPNTNLNGSSGVTRYVASERKLPDQNTGLDEKTIQVCSKNLRLLCEAELSERFEALPIVRVLRDGRGNFAADPSFIPPSLALNASPSLEEMLRRQIEILEEKSAALQQVQQQRSGAFQAGMSARQVAQYWFLHTLNSSIPTLRHFVLSRHAHPQEVFREMARLGGALCTFGLEVDPRSLPHYDHFNLGACFATMDEHIRRHLEIVMPSKAIRIPLHSVQSFLYRGEISDERCLGPSRWILEVSSRIGEADLITNATRLAKVCSARFVLELIKRAVPGLILRHLHVAPPQISSRVEAQYFSIQREGPCWEHIVKTREVGIYIPAEIPSPQLSLFVLLDD